MRRKLVKAGVVALAFVPGIASAQFGGTPWHVNDLPGQGNFEVIEGFSGFTTGFWCRAGNYAVTEYGARGADRIYVMTPYGRSQVSDKRRAVGFTVSPDADLLAKAAGVNSNSLSVSREGYNITVGHAKGYCTLNHTIGRP